MDLVELQRHWDGFGRQDPFWAILAHPAYRGNRWPLDEFFETGRVEVFAVMEDATGHGVPHARRRALDFGCGAGRLTQALADHFENALGIDVAPSMIALARAHNRHGERCRYEINDRPDLSRWPDSCFDLIYTGRVLQHMEPRYSTAYVREFVRVLAPGGYLSFDLPSESGEAVASVEGTVPPSSMRALVEVDVLTRGSLDVGPGALVPFRVAVTNLSDLAWRATKAHPINVGNHWLYSTGVMVAYDGARTGLPAVLEPGARAHVEIVVSAPTVPGTYRLQFDVVQEGVAWFATCGSQLAELTLSVGGAESSPQQDDSAADPQRSPTADADRSFQPVMEMHAVPRHEVEAALADAGARLLDVRRVYHCGPLWLAYRYDVTR